MEIFALSLWTVIGAAITAISAYVLSRTLPSRSLLTRTLLATGTAFAPIVILIGIAVLPSHVDLLLRLSAEEFLIPLAIQVSMILIVCTPIAWAVSRRKTRDEDISSVFE